MMPYKNITFIKLLWKDLLHENDRFTEQLDDDEKGLYLMLLLLAGATNNNIKNDENYVKRVLNLQKSPENIRKNIDKICDIYPKLIDYNGYLKFKNFKKIHNYLRNADGTPKDSPKSAQNRIDIDKIIKEYIRKKKYPVYFENGSKDKDLEQAIFRRNVRTAKNLLVLSKNNFNQVIEAMGWFGDICDKKGLSWSLETIEKWFPEFLVKGKTNSYDQLLENFNLKKE